MRWSLISAVNNEAVLERCLLKSPDADSLGDVILRRGHPSAASAYNAGMDEARGELLMFAHQDMYFPAGWFDRVQSTIRTLSAQDPGWGVLGVWGRRDDGECDGHLCWTGKGIAGRSFEGVVEVQTLDEVVIIFRKSSGLRFDEGLGGFHMYGSDIALQARTLGMKSYVLSALCIHNTNEYGMLPWDFWKAYFFMRKKWRSHLPVLTTCTDIRYSCWPMLRWNVVRWMNLKTGRDKQPARRADDPTTLLATPPSQRCPSAVCV